MRDPVPHQISVAKHVDAISMLLGERVLCVITLDSEGSIGIVTPTEIHADVHGILALIDWSAHDA